MDKPTRDTLERWEQLQSGDGLQSVGKVIKALWLCGSASTLFVVFSVAYGLSPIVVAIGAAVSGWIIAETNALRHRLSQWPTISRYIDWWRVRADLATLP